MQATVGEPFWRTIVSDNERNQMIGQLVSDKAEARKSLAALREKRDRIAAWLQQLGSALAGSSQEVPKLISYSTGLGFDLGQLQSILGEISRLQEKITECTEKLRSFGIPE
jgi:uncharacterized coiled-coil DUF342 family protein